LKPDGGRAAPKHRHANYTGIRRLRQIQKRFKEAAVDRFGSGYAPVRDAGRLEVMSTQNANPPLADGKEILLVCDVWRHADYLDYRNRHGDYVDAFPDHVVNWAYVQERMREPMAAVREFAWRQVLGPILRSSEPGRREDPDTATDGRAFCSGVGCLCGWRWTVCRQLRAACVWAGGFSDSA